MSTPHRFRVAQLVRLVRQTGARNAARVYEVQALLADDDGTPRYRVHSHEAGTAEVGEADLVAATHAGRPRS